MRELTEEELAAMDRSNRQCFVCGERYAWYNNTAEVDLCALHSSYWDMERGRFSATTDLF